MSERTEEQRRRSREAAKRWRDRNKDKVAAYNAAYYAAHKAQEEERSTRWRKENGDAWRESRRRHYKKNADRMRVAKRATHLRTKYGLAPSDFDAMWSSQAGACAICTLAFPSRRAAHVDHCHATGKVRGLLCVRCNTFLGHLERGLDGVSRFLDYLKR